MKMKRFQMTPLRMICFPILFSCNSSLFVRLIGRYLLVHHTGKQKKSIFRCIPMMIMMKILLRNISREMFVAFFPSCLILFSLILCFIIPLCNSIRKTNNRPYKTMRRGIYCFISFFYLGSMRTRLFRNVGRFLRIRLLPSIQMIYPLPLHGRGERVPITRIFLLETVCMLTLLISYLRLVLNRKT